MTYSYPERIDIRHLTTNQPFYGGVALIYQGKLVVLLYADGLSSGSNNPTDRYRIGGISGEHLPGETIWECAQREARARLNAEIILYPSPHMYFHDIDSGEVAAVSCTDPLPPLLFERQSNFYAYTSPRIHVSSRPYTYFGTFLARVSQGSLQPHPSVKALLLLPPQCWPLLAQRVTLDMLLQHGAELMEQETVVHSSHLLLHPGETLNTVVTVLKKHPELLMSGQE